MKIWGQWMSFVIILMTWVWPQASYAQKSTRRMDVEFQPKAAPKPATKVATPGLVQKIKEPTRFALYLKAFNDTHTPGEIYHRLASVTSPEWKSWYAATHRPVPLHRTSVEFMQENSFLIRTPGSMSMINTTRMDEGVILISRRPFPFTLRENISDIAGRLGRIDVRLRYESQLPLFKIFEMLFGSTVSWANNHEASVRIAPMMALIDIERSRANCLNVIEETPTRGPASTPLSTDCRLAIAEMRGIKPSASPTLPSRRIVETAQGPSPITGPGSIESPRTSRAPAAVDIAPVAQQGNGRD